MRRFIFTLLATLFLAIAMAGGAFIGRYAWPEIAAYAIAVSGGKYHGFAYILDHYIEMVGTVLGGATAFAFFMSLGSGRRPAGWVLIIAGASTLLFLIPIEWEFIRWNGRRLALAVDGLPMIWVCLLGYWGYRMQRYPLHRPGFCRSCGYNLRASKDTCPECGATIPVKAG